MNSYVLGTMIKKIREKKGLTQSGLAKQLGVSDKAVSKWETGKGYPDITLLEPLSRALQVSVAELMAGADVTNSNKSANMNKMKFYVCPICSNVVLSTGETVVSCCGVTLPPLETEEPDENHTLTVENIEDEYFVSTAHEMSKEHYISFIAAVRDDGAEVVKLYPQGPAQAFFKRGRVSRIYYYCNHHGLFGVCMKNIKIKE